MGEFDLERGDLKVRIKFAQETSGADLARQMARLLSAQQHAPAPTVLPEVLRLGRLPRPRGAQRPQGQRRRAQADEDASLHV